MAKLNVILLIILLAAATTWTQSSSQDDNWAKTLEGENEKTTNLQFYFHDTLSGSSPSAVKVAQPSPTYTSLTLFGQIMMADDPLTVGPDPNSKLVGRAQGIYGSAAKNEVGLIMAMNFCFEEGAYNGSSISLLGKNSAMNQVREMPIIGGTGLFRLARGYALAHTYWANFLTGDAIVGYNVTLIH